MKLFTMFSSMDKAIADVAAGKTAIERAMRHIAGSEEWGVRITRRPVGAAPASGKAASRVTGAAFLAAKKDARDASAQGARGVAGGGGPGLQSPHALRQGRQQRPRRQEPGTNPPILEAAFLVTSGSRAPFQGGGETAGGPVRVGRGRHDADRPVARLQFHRRPEGVRVKRRPGQPSGSARPRNPMVRSRAGDRVTRPFQPARVTRPSDPTRRRRKEAARAAAARGDAEAGVAGAENARARSGTSGGSWTRNPRCSI